ncbi:MAG TPA: phosphoadenylyl-sulfate reductase [Acidimicrobiales bacterium]|nr:phosphoadenylyl-sulfate reductase [Acidimicrobiales bacterium]
MTTVDLTDGDLAGLSASFETATASEIVAWAVETFGDGLSLAASMADAVLIDVASRVHPGIEVVFLDTQYHFPETLATAERVRTRYKLQLRVLTPDREPDDLWRSDTDACCDARKVRPMMQHLAQRSAWMSGLRRAESDARRDAAIVERDRRGLVKINPLATWSDADVDAYIAEHDVPLNPLLFDGYRSIGCWPCTRRVEAGEDARAGRWAGSSKTECGLHL